MPHLAAVLTAVAMLGMPQHTRPAHITRVHMTCAMYGELGGDNAYKVRCWGYKQSRRSASGLVG